MKLEIDQIQLIKTKVDHYFTMEDGGVKDAGDIGKKLVRLHLLLSDNKKYPEDSFFDFYNKISKSEYFTNNSTIISAEFVRKEILAEIEVQAKELCGKIGCSFDEFLWNKDEVGVIDHKFDNILFTSVFASLDRISYEELEEVLNKMEEEDKNEFLGHQNQNRDFYTLLMYAVEVGNVNALRALKNHGADHEFVTLDGSSGIHLAAFSGNLLMLNSYVMLHNANVDSINNLGETPLHVAVSKKGNIACAKCLLQNKATIDVNRNDGHTPLTLALKNRDAEMVKLLLSYKADVNFKMLDGTLPLDLVNQMGKDGQDKELEYMIQLLMEFDAKAESKGEKIEKAKNVKKTLSKFIDELIDHMKEAAEQLEAAGIVDKEWINQECENLLGQINDYLTANYNKKIEDQLAIESFKDYIEKAANDVIGKKSSALEGPISKFVRNTVGKVLDFIKPVFEIKSPIFAEIDNLKKNIGMLVIDKLYGKSEPSHQTSNVIRPTAVPNKAQDKGKDGMGM